MINEQRRISLGANKTELKTLPTEVRKLCPRSLFQAVNGLVQLAYMMRI
jgi:hypothetical protein